MLLLFLYIALGFAALIFGANWLVGGATSLAKKHGVSDLVIGLTIVAFGTSAPELLVNAVAAYNGHSDLVVSNVIGSNNFNLFIILGIAGLIYPIKVKSSTAWREIPISLFASLLVLMVANNLFVGSSPTVISLLDSAILLLAFGVFLFYIFRQLQTDPLVMSETKKQSTNLKIWASILFGLAALIGGGKLAVDNAVEIAHELGWSERIIGLTILAAGTSLPELVTSVVAALKKNSDIAVGNVIGSNIFNLLLVLSISGFIQPIDFQSRFNTDLLILIAGTLFLFLAMFTGGRKKFDRWEAGLIFLAYITYSVTSF